jgi:monoamine oxidase
MPTRRDFLTKLGQAGGFSAAYVMMQSLGLLSPPASYASVLRLSPESGKGKRVVILGAGIAGMVAGMELRKAGYQCHILEARRRAGGRNWTIRNGTRVDLTDGTSQTCHFEEGHYFNAGPARLPSHHHTILGYCHEFGVQLEVEVNTSRSSLLQSDKLNGGHPVEQRQVLNDTRGHVAELLAKCVQRNALDQELTKHDKERMLEFLRIYGDLSPDYFYKGSSRSGYRVMPGAGDVNGVLRDPLDMTALLDANLWNNLYFDEVFDMQPTMFQPVGGMDKVAGALEKQVSKMIRFGAVVEQIRKTGQGVRIVYHDDKSGPGQSIEADYCICTLPVTILKTLDTDFSPDLKSAIQRINYDSAFKIAWESRRFWEQDDGIYGGLSYPENLKGVVWYPSAELFSPRGVVIGGYGIENGTDFETMDMPAKLQASRAAIEGLHPGHSRELTNPVYVSWGHVAYNLGSWVSGFGRKSVDSYEYLIRPDGPIYLAGDHTSHMVGWQEGAALSAHRAVTLIDQAVQSQNAAA